MKKEEGTCAGKWESESLESVGKHTSEGCGESVSRHLAKASPRALSKSDGEGRACGVSESGMWLPVDLPRLAGAVPVSC